MRGICACGRSKLPCCPVDRAACCFCVDLEEHLNRSKARLPLKIPKAEAIQTELKALVKKAGEAQFAIGNKAFALDEGWREVAREIYGDLPKTDCTCVSILNGHENQCPYPRKFT